MRKYLFALLLLSTHQFSTPAIADEWSGLYVGAHVGHGWADWDSKLDTTAGCWPDYCPGTESSAGYLDPFKTLSDKGWLGGGQIGYNTQWGSWVFGLEADVSWGDIEAGGTFDTDHPWYIEPFTKQPKYRKKHDLSLDAFGTARVRAGYATGSFLPYVTGGLAWGKAQGDIAVSYPHLAKFVELGHTLVEKWYATNPVTYGEVDETHVGWTIGGGFEWKLRHDISLKAEYLYVDLGKETYLFKGPLDPSINQPFNTDSFESELTFHTVRVGLNYHFNTAE